MIALHNSEAAVRQGDLAIGLKVDEKKEVEPNTGAADTDNSGSLNDDGSEVNGNESHIPETIPNSTKPIMARPAPSPSPSAPMSPP